MHKYTINAAEWSWPALKGRRDAAKALTWDAVGIYAKSPALYRGIIDRAPGVDSTFYEESAFDEAFRTMLLDVEEEFEARYQVTAGPINPKTGAPYGRETKAFAQWLEETGIAPARLVAPTDRDLMARMAHAVFEFDDGRLAKRLKILTTIKRGCLSVEYSDKLELAAEICAASSTFQWLLRVRPTRQFDKSLDELLNKTNEEHNWLVYLASLCTDIPVDVDTLLVERAYPYRCTICRTVIRADVHNARIRPYIDWCAHYVECYVYSVRNGYWPTGVSPLIEIPYSTEDPRPAYPRIAALNRTIIDKKTGTECLTADAISV
jgi:hypothetical protein